MRTIPQVKVKQDNGQAETSQVVAKEKKYEKSVATQMEEDNDQMKEVKTEEISEGQTVQNNPKSSDQNQMVKS